ncbi:MAG TPA: hypothetical protein DDY52_00330 [Candidatus Moranbacteria bacterium]|nr:MAG: hypothetical protein UR51_C0027G0002 [Candidatus Moranbacteria bacterium GW2011_GWF1_34_10]HBI16595.1 hypothetical protein [Candidatus Moranbacteria bacterium]
MGIKNDIEKFASDHKIALRDYQKSNLRNIEREYDGGKIDKDGVVNKVAFELKKEGRLLSSGEMRELKGKLH